MRTRTLEFEVNVQSRDLGIVDPEVAFKLLDLSEVEFDEDGKPQGIKPLLKDLVAKKPYLVGAGNGSSPGNPATDRRKGTLTLDDFKNMSSAEINANWDEYIKLSEEANKK